MTLHKHVFSLLAILWSIKGMDQQGCVNIWNADLNNPNINLCPVDTNTGEKCKLPFMFNGVEYKSCIINSPNNLGKLPQCLTNSDTWANCQVPTGAVVTKVTTRKNGSPSINGVSLNGGTLLWISGLRFAFNLFSFDPTTATSNEVFLVNGASSYNCEIHPDKVTSTQITCYVPALPEGKYLVRVKVNGALIPLYQYESIDNAYILASDSNTPKINNIEPYSGTPGSFVNINGDFKTYCYTRDVEECSDDSGARISRVYFGGQICNLIDPVTNNLYGEVTQNRITCKLEGSEINVFNASMLVSEQYGRSLTSRDAFFVSPDERIYNFQSYPELSNVSPQTGSVLGETYLTLIGSYFYHDQSLPAQIEIGGTKCEVVSYEPNNRIDSKLVCKTSAQPARSNEYPGGRGITLIRDNILTSDANLQTATPSVNSVISELRNASFIDNQTVDVTVWLKGFFVPQKSSNYEFNFQTNAPGILFLSVDQTSLNKLVLIDLSSGSINTKAIKFLEANKKYYIEAVSSKSRGSLILEINAKMLDTVLTDSVSNKVQNEIQEIEIDSVVTMEEYLINFNNSTTDGVQEVQEIRINSSLKAPFVLSFDGAQTAQLDFQSTDLDVLRALSDLPTLGANLVNVNETLSADDFVKTFTVSFHSSLGDVPKIEEALKFVTTKVTELTKGVSNGKHIQLIIENQAGKLFDVLDSSENIKSAIEESFSIRCPNSISNPGKNEFNTFDFEDECQVSDKPLNETAFCGKCARNSNIIFNGLNSSLVNNFVCFAYKLSKPINYLELEVYYGDSINSYGVNFLPIADFQWHYECVDLLIPALKDIRSSLLFMKQLKFPSSVGADVLIDVVSIRKTLPFKHMDQSLVTSRRVYPSIQIFPNTLTVQKDNNSIKFSYRPNNCSSNLNLIQIRQASANIIISRTSQSSPPVTGSFDLAWNGQSLRNIPSNVSENVLKDYIDSLKNFGSSNIIRSKDCAGYKWSIKWLNGGDKSDFSISSSSLSGNGPTIAINKIQDGAVLFYPLLDDILRTYHSKPQVVVSINNIPVKCSNSCDFEWVDSSTPVVNSIDTSNPNSIVLNGSGFDSIPSNNLVKIGDSICNVISSTSTQITCQPGNGPAGSFGFSVNVLGKGLSRMNSNALFDFYLTATSFSPKTSGVGGGIIVNITGSGFSEKVKVTVDSNECKIVFVSFNLIRCLIPSNPTNSDKSVDVIVTDSVNTVTLLDKFLYDYTNSPKITNVSPNILSVLGNEIVTIQGTNLPVPIGSINIGNQRVRVLSNTMTEIKIETPKMNPGVYELLIPHGDLGNIKATTLIEYKLYISSIKPKIGSIRGGTLVTIYGEGFSRNCSLNKVSFTDYECEINSCSADSITCLTSNANTVHEITNDGVNNVYGNRYAWDRSYITINKGEKVRWSWQPPVAVSGSKFKVEQVSTPFSEERTGFSSGEPTEFGSYTYQFQVPGIYYYWSGYVDLSQVISFRGVIEVLDKTIDKELEIDVTLNGIKAQKCSFPFVYKSISYNSCTNTDQAFNWCSPNSTFTGQILKCEPLNPIPDPSCSTKSVDLTSCNATNVGPYSLKFTHCQVPKITNISPLNVNYNTLITIDGTGFSSNQCENEVYLGGKKCSIQSSSTSRITCKLGANSGLSPNKLYDVEVLVKNIGFALQNDYYQINFQQVITSLTPTRGSNNGGTKVTINGDGFTPDSYVIIGNNFFDQKRAQITYNSIILETLPDDEKQFNVTVQNKNIDALCEGVCLFDMNSAYSPVINTVSPLTISDRTELTLDGNNFGIDSQLVKIRIGNQNCNITSIAANRIKCILDGLDLGQQNINLNIENLGNAISNIQVTGVASLTSINPVSGSVNGGTKVTISGNGFSNYTAVRIGNSVCEIEKIKINEIVCLTTSHLAQNSVPIEIRNGNLTYPSNAVTFSYSDAQTPVITLINPLFENSLNSELTITGSGFSNNLNDVHVSIGSSLCNVTSSTSTQIKCTLGINGAGVYPINLLINPYGLAAKNTLFTYNLAITSISNSQSGVAGGLVLEINGNGYSSMSRVLICENQCEITSASNTQIKCVVPKSSNLNGDSDCQIVVTENGMNATTSFKYIKAITPLVSNAQPSRGGTGGGTLITISGSGFPNSGVTVLIAGSECSIRSISSNEIKCSTGSYSNSSIKALIEVFINGVGLALNNDVSFEYIDLWSSRYTWGGHEPPAEGELVVIEKYQTVYFDTETPVLKGIIILGGALIFDDNQDVHLRAEYIIIVDDGKLQIGTEQKPFLHNAKITMFGSVRSIELPIFGSKVIALRNGTIDMHGKPVGVTWTHLGQTADSGSSQIILKEPVLWEVGSEIVIATTGNYLSQGENEVRKISAISIDKKTLTLDTPLTYTHLSVIRTIGSGIDTRQVEIRAEVGLLTRNVVYQGNNDESWSSLKSSNACPSGYNPGEFAVQTCFLGRYGDEIGTDEFGATIMVSGDMSKPNREEESVKLRLSNVELFHVGQAFRLGRYPIHFHMNGDMPSSYVKECSIHESFNRAVNIHATNYVTVEKNFIYNIMGGAYFLEDGVEIGNVFKYNLAVFVKTSSSLLNEDVTPAAFWVTNPNNTYLHNSVAGGTHFGWWYRILDTPDGPSARPDYCPKKIPMGKFFNNTVHGVGRFGLWVFPGYYPSVTGGCRDPNPSVAKFEHLTTYNNDKGAEWVMSNSLQFRNIISFDHESAGIETKTIIFNDDVNTRYKTTFFDATKGPLIADSIIAGNSDSSKPVSITQSGLIVAWDRGLLVQNVSFFNFPDYSSHAIRATVIAGRCTFGCGGWTTKYSGLKFSNVLYKTVHRWDWDTVYHDLDGSLTGKANSVVVYNNNFTKTDSRCIANPSFNNGIACQNTNEWIRFAFNQYTPEYAFIVNVTNSRNQKESIPRLTKRLTHKKGFMIALESNQEYTLEFDSVPNPANISYSGTFYALSPNSYLIIKHKMLKKPDRVLFGSLTSTEAYAELSSANNLGDWYWNNVTGILSYIITNKNGIVPFLDVAVRFEAYKCRYANCEPPISPALKLPVTKRPDDALFWSNVSTWSFSEPGWGGYGANGNFRLPQNYESVKIPSGKYIVVDCVLPIMKYLQIEGILELDNGLNHKLEADVIFINGGQLIVGWENNPILTNVEIVLNGQKDTLDYKLPNQIDSIGGKAIGVYGGLDIHGRPRQPAWTTLELTAPKGSNIINLRDPVDWDIGEKIVITTTSYIINQTEVFTIASKSPNNKTLTLNSPLQYEHLGFMETLDASTSYRIGAGVGLLSRNVKITGAEYDKQSSDLYGFRIIVSDYSTIGEDGIVYYKGYARLSNVELNHPGQFSRNSGDDYKYGILFSNLGAYNYSRPSYVNNCAFHHGFSAAVGISDSQSIPITNNVIYYTIDFAIRVTSHSNIIKKNLVTTNYWASSFITWEAKYDKTYWGAIDAHLADSIILEDNFIAGSERVGLFYKGDICDNYTFPYNHSIKNNIIYSTLSGVTILPDFYYNVPCLKISGFSIFKSSHWGIYYQAPVTLSIESNILVDNQINIFTQVLGPNILNHEMSNKKIFIKNNLIVGQSVGFNCQTDIKSNDLNFNEASSIRVYTAGPNSKSKVGITWAQFVSGANGASFKPWAGIMSYNALDGIMLVDNCTFVHFKSQCDSERDYVISTNKNNDDGQHPIVLKNIKYLDVEHEAKIWIHRPNIGKINPSDCIDMDCDGLKKNLLTDEDGSFLGQPGSVISQSEFEWGSQQRGLGDFRIPKEALSSPNGTMLPTSDLYTYLGIVREENKCTYQSTWQAYECHGLNHKVLTIESMDADTETRRLSPIAIVSDNKYLDLINGPQDHGWCFGYTCQKRVSSFMAIIAEGKSYDIYLTSTPPKQLRFRILNADLSFKTKISVYYSTSNRVDVYKNDRLVDATNSYYKDGKLYFNDTSSNLNSFMPTLLSPSGTNLAVRSHRKVYATIGGSDYFDFKIASVVVLKFGVASTTPDSFFNRDTLVQNFADLLGIDPSKIRKVEIIRANSKKKRSTELNYIELFIFENAPADLNANFDQIELNLKEIAINATTLFTTGELQQLAKDNLGLDLSYLSIVKPLMNDSVVEIKQIKSLKIVREASNCNEQSPCQIQPILLILDENNQAVIGLDSWKVIARLSTSSNPSARIIYETEALVRNDGFIQFEFLGISDITNFVIEFELRTPSNNTIASVPSVQQTSKTSNKAVLTCRPNDQTLIVDSNQKFNLSFVIVDQILLRPIQNIDWKNHQWQASARIYGISKSQPSGVLRSTTNMIEINSQSSSIKLLDLSIDSPGMYLIEFIVVTSNNDYFLRNTSRPVIIKRSDQNIILNEQNEPNIYLEFDSSFDQSGEKANIIRAIIYNSFVNKYNLTLTKEISLYDGKLANFAVELSINLAKLENEWNNGFKLIDNVNLIKARIVEQDYSVRVAETVDVVQTVVGTDGVSVGSSVIRTNGAIKLAPIYSMIITILAIISFRSLEL
ncbi:unnamed protein product [Brachionus calyciflorus]|uniref:Fibrocystin-L n=1 Tax=Brachionus calyciflorus TaxID=104777 RepID=A0A813M0A8_9BILA|nr:unnamed protein product [Brachionus calyciflorus]